MKCVKTIKTLLKLLPLLILNKFKDLIYGRALVDL